MSDDVILSARGLCKTYRGDGASASGLVVLDGVDIDVHPGEMLAIVGASGSGKSTLLHLMGGLDDATTGEVKIAGQSLRTLDERERGVLRNHKLGFVYQFHHLLAEFSAQENVAMPLLIRRTSAATALERASRMLERVGLSARAAHRPGELSGGERQRVALARALVTEPACVLADEPTGNLDRRTAHDMFQMLRALCRELNTAVVIVTHDLELAAMTDRQLTLREGKLQTAQVDPRALVV